MSFAVAKIGNTRILVHVTFVLTATVLIASGYTLYFIVFAGSLLIHEMGHLIVAVFLDAEITEVEFWAFGAVGKLEGAWQIEPWSEAMIAISGPFQSALLAALGFLAYLGYTARAPGVYVPGQFPLLEFLVKVNCGLVAVNLLPCLPLDGGRFLRAQMSLKAGYKKASQKVAKIGIALGLCFAVIGIVGILSGYEWYSMAILGPLLIWGSIEEREVAVLQNVLSLLLRNERLARRGAIPVEELMVHENVKVKEVVQELRPSKYHVILVVDRQMTLLGSVTETKLLEAFYKGSLELRIKELI